MSRHATTVRWFGLAVFLAGASFGSCKCPSAENIDVSPDCPDGREAPTVIQVTAQLRGIRPVGEAKQLRVRGNRDTEADLCFAPGAEVSFLRTIEGTDSESETVSNLAHGGWEIRITALSGGGHAPVDLGRVLPGGSTSTLTITANSAGDLTASF